MKGKVLLIIIIGLLSFGTLFSQTITYAEYFFDNDPGVRGVGTHEISPLTFIGDSANFNFSTAGLTEGYHWLTIRVRDDLGRWSIANSHKFYIYDDSPWPTPPPPGDIIGFEYLFDDDTGAGTGTWTPATMDGDSAYIELDVPTAGLSEGYHQLLVRTKDENGNWSTGFTHKIYVYDTTYKDLRVEPSRLMAAEYFFDKDTVPNGQGTPLNITPGDEVEWTGKISVEGLNEGEHFLFVRVKDSLGIWSMAFAKPFNVVNLSVETNSPVCTGSNDGWAKVTLEGGTPPFTYLWDDEFQQKTDSASGLAPGTYTVIVTDSEGAIVKETVEITAYDPIYLSVTTDNTECNIAGGSATVQVDSGGIGPFTYLWTGGDKPDEKSVTNLRSGIYYVTVTDNRGCSNTAIATINDENGPQISLDAIQHLDCAGDADGAIDVSISGGSGGYSVQWSNGETSQDIINLTAGTYEITVYDDQMCRGSESFVIEEPDAITFKLSVLPSDCNQSTGGATVSVYGGTYPYYYSWSSGGFEATETGLAAGVYTVTVTDENGCEADTKVAVSDKDAPVVNVTEIVESTCGNLDGEIHIIVAGGATGIYTFSWMKDEVEVGTSEDLIGVGPGDYNVTVRDGTCKTLATATIPAELPPTDQICLVTVDTATGKNLIAWEKTAGEGIISYNIYRETSQAGVYDLITNWPFDSLSQYTDIFADPSVRSWRYKISALDDCGQESRLSAYHKTMHLTLNLGIGGVVNLIWNHYEGFIPFEGSYLIWRLGGTGWEHIATVPRTLNSYTDQTPPAGVLWYYVEAVHPTGCTPLKAGTLNSSRSNRQSRLKTGVQEELNAEYNLRIYPNPSSGKFTLSMYLEKAENVDIRIYDLTGKLVYVSTFENYVDRFERDIDISQFASGIYHLTIKTDKGLFNYPLILE